MTLKELFEELGRAAAQARVAVIDQVRDETIRRHFAAGSDENGEDVLVANTLPVQIAPGFVAPVPTFIMERPERIQNKRIVAELETDVTLGETGIEVGLKRGLRKRQAHLKIKAEFDLAEPTEGAALVEDAINGEMRRLLSPALAALVQSAEPEEPEEE